MARWWSCVWVLLFLILHLHNAGAVGSPVSRREDAAPAVTVTPTTTATAHENEASTETTDHPKSTREPTVDTTTPITASVTVTSTTSFPSAINGNKPASNNATETPSAISEGQLPIHPRLTPGWGIAGVILLISGATYTLVGIKKPLLHTFFSAAFLSALSVTVLITYVMVTPVPAAIEGAYVVAAVVAGLILGGAATIFRELTEGLGCLLGGFCFAMWLLTLKAGALFNGTPARAIFIAIFAVVGYALYFSRHTRPFAQMGLMSFAGATVTVIGIDCFSRAGLKEFWAYIWELNTGLFPDNTTTYPLTKGIRVEIALTVVFTVIGIISQLKLWRVIQEHRAKKVEEEAKEQQARDEEEAALGLQLEAQVARERQQWENVYGNPAPRSSTGSRNSGLDVLDDEKMDHTGRTATQEVSSSEDNIEMAELSAPDAAESPYPVKQRPAHGLMATNQYDDMGVVIRVAKDDDTLERMDGTPEANEEVRNVNGDIESYAGAASSHAPRVPPKSPAPAPAVTPLPFKIPDELEADDSRSSVAAYADEDEEADGLGRRPSILSLASRLSASSGNLLRSISKHSAKPASPKRKSKGFEAKGSPEWNGSTEKLVESRRNSSDALSVAATIDGLSQDPDDFDFVTSCESPRHSAPPVVPNADEVVETNPIAKDIAESDVKLKPLKYGWGLDVRPSSLTDTVGTDIPRPSGVTSPSGDASKESTHHDTRKSESTNDNTHPTEVTGTEVTSEFSKAPKSLAHSVASVSMSLTKDRLPSALPRVALSYRTNEWAKHLSMAEAPPLEQLQLEEDSQQTSEGNVETEIPAPVHVEELQQTAESGIPPAASGQLPSPTVLTPSPSQMLPATHRTLSRMSSYSDAGAMMNSIRPSPSNLSQASHNFRMRGARRSWEVHTQPIQEDENELNGSGGSTPNSNTTAPSPLPGVVPYSSPHTLLGRREMLLRHRSQPQQLAIPPILEQPNYITRSPSQMSNYAMPALMTQEADDIPLSQRKQLIRQSSMVFAHPQSAALSPIPRSISHPIMQVQSIAEEPIKFDSHQPERQPTIPSQADRDARLSHFRQSVAFGLRSATPMVGVQGRETPLVSSASSSFLLQTDVDRAIDQQRTMLLTQRDQEAQKREMERWEKERNDRTFEEMMRRGDLMDAHREALRRMQGGVKQDVM